MSISAVDLMVVYMGWLEPGREIMSLALSRMLQMSISAVVPYQDVHQLFGPHPVVEGTNQLTWHNTQEAACISLSAHSRTMQDLR